MNPSSSAHQQLLAVLVGCGLGVPVQPLGPEWTARDVELRVAVEQPADGMVQAFRGVGKSYITAAFAPLGAVLEVVGETRTAIWGRSTASSGVLLYWVGVGSGWFRYFQAR
jgi:hypothetical protein